jgi:hypothetical protein
MAERDLYGDKWHGCSPRCRSVKEERAPDEALHL